MQCAVRTVVIEPVAEVVHPQQDIIRKILEHCGLWQDPPSRSPPRATRSSQPCDQPPDPDSRLTHKVDPDFLEYALREQLEQLELLWEP